MDEGVEDSHAPVRAVLVDPVRPRVTFGVEPMQDLDSVRQRRSPRGHDARLQTVTHGAFASTSVQVQVQVFIDTLAT